MLLGPCTCCFEYVTSQSQPTTGEGVPTKRTAPSRRLWTTARYLFTLWVGLSTHIVQCPRPQSVSANHSIHSELQESHKPGHTDPLALSIFTPQLFRMYPPADCIKGYITEGDMEDIIECYSGQALVKEELSKAELEVQGVQTWQEFVVQRAYISYFEI